MSTKTIALDSKVYEKLAHIKNESESFSKLIDRLVEQKITSHTGAAILASLQKNSTSLTEEEAATMKTLVEQNRRNEKWERHDLS